jgi:hypothetical protein
MRAENTYVDRTKVVEYVAVIVLDWKLVPIYGSSFMTNNQETVSFEAEHFVAG